MKILKNKINDEAKINYLKKFKSGVNSGENNFVNSQRNSAADSLENLNFPTIKNENWKYTNVSSVLKQDFNPVVSELSESIKADIKSKMLTGIEAINLIFVDGKYETEISDKLVEDDGTYIGNITDGFSEHSDLIEKYFGKSIKYDNGFDALNSMFMADGLFINLPKNKVIEIPVNVVFYSSQENALVSPRNLVIAAENSQIKITAHFIGVDESKYFVNTASEFVIAQNAIVDYYKVQEQNDNSFHIDKTEITQEATSEFGHYSFSFGASLARADINISLKGENSTGHLNGLYLGKDNQHVDHHTFVDHAVPNCFSNELYKGILDNNAHGVFNGKVLVRKDAQKTNAYQSNKTILLSENAAIDTKPQLEIYADDVKCSHGATIGSLDDEAYFYVRSRGIPAELAKSMLIKAFAYDVVDKVKINELKELLNHKIFEHLTRVEIGN